MKIKANFLRDHSLAVALCALVCWLIPSSVWASVEIDGIYYELNTSSKTAEVVSNPDYYSGTINIPASFVYQGSTYNVTSIGNEAFGDCTGLTSVDIPNSVTSIDDDAFSGCTGLTSVVIPNGVTSLGLTFYGCTGLTSVTIPNSVTSIGLGTFNGCSSLTSVTIPNSVTFIDGGAFAYCSSLTEIIVERTTAPTITPSTFLGINATCKVYVPEGCLSAYTNALYWNNFSDIEERTIIATGSCGSNVTYILYSDMTMVITGTGSVDRISTFINNDYYQSIKKVIIEEGVTTLLANAFRDCTSLTSVEIPNSVTRIDNDAFYGTAWYDNQPDGLVYAGKNVYKYKGEMPQGTEIVIKNGTLTIGYGAFSRCTGLVSVEIPNSVTTIRPLAFLGCTGLSSITIPESVTGIEDDAFIDCTSLTSITVECVTPPYPASVEADYANCVLYVPFGSKTAYENAWVWSWFENIVESPVLIDNLYYSHNISDNTVIVERIADQDYSGSITIPESIEYAGNTYAVTEIGHEAFLYCTGLTSVEIPNSVTRIVEGAFYGCAGLTSVEIPNGVTYIDDYTFDSCTGLTSVDIPNSVTNIGMCAFGRCTSLTSVDIPNSVTHIGDGAFVRCIGLTSIVIPNSVIEIGVEAFENCTGLTSVTVEWTNPLAIESSIFENVDKSACTLYVPVGTKEAYENAEGWKEFENIVEISEEPDTDISEYDNIVYIESAEALVGQQIRLSLKMNNTIASTGFQCDIYLPEGVTAAQDEDGFYLMDISEERTTTRKTDYSASVMQPDGGLRFMCSSTNSFTFSGNEGEVAYLMVDIDPNMEEGTYPLILRNISISDANAHAYHVDYVKTTLTIHTYTLGDANNDGGIDVADFTAIANYIMGTPPASFVDKAADVNVDDEINVADLTGVANLILHGTVSPNASHAKARNDAAAKYANIGANDVTANSDEEFTVAVTIDGNYAYSGYQFDVTLPEGMTVKDVYGQTKASDVFMSGMIDDNTLRVLCASTTGETAENTVVNLTLVADSEGSYNIDIDNAFVSANASSCAMRNSSFLVAIDSEATGISTMGDESSSNDVVYDLMGKKLKSNGNVSSLQRGIYIINGKKITK